MLARFGDPPGLGRPFRSAPGLGAQRSKVVGVGPGEDHVVGPKAINVGGIPEFLVDNQNGFLIEHRDPTQLTQKVLTLLQNPKLAKEMGDCGRKLIEENFDWRLITSQVIDLYHNLLENA